MSNDLYKLETKNIHNKIFIQKNLQKTAGQVGRAGENRTLKTLLPPDFESGASTNSATTP